MPQLPPRAGSQFHKGKFHRRWRWTTFFLAAFVMGGWTDASAAPQVPDDEDTLLTLALPNAVVEGTAAAGTISISGTLSTPLVVTLVSSDETRLAPGTVTIPAGATSAAFTISAPDNALTDGAASVMITASTPGFTDSTATIAVWDDDVHHLAFSGIGQQIPNAPFSVTLTAKDVNDVTITSFTGTASLSATGAAGTIPLNPAITGDFAAGVWMGNISVTSASTGVVLTAKGSAGGVGDSAPFDVLVGPMHHFTWNTQPASRTVNQPFPVTITARDIAENVTTSFTGRVSLTASGGVTTGTLLNSPVVSESFFSFVTQTLGYAFTPVADISVTALRSCCGSKVSIWTNSGQLLTSVPITAPHGAWSETPLAAPLQLKAGVTYRIGFMVGPNQTFYRRTDLDASFPHGSIVQGYSALADAFPTTTSSAKWSLVDLRYQAMPATVPLAPTQTGDFVAGVWSENLTLSQAARLIKLRADDGGGHTGESGTFDAAGALSVATPASLTEGGSPGTGTVTLSEMPATDFVIALSSSNPAEASVPATVRVLPGQRTASFPITVLNDNRIDGTQSVVITARLPGWQEGTASVDVLDNEDTKLRFSFLGDVDEGGVARFYVDLSGTLSTPLVVTLQSSDPAQLTGDTTVTIPAGSTWEGFGVRAPDNSLFDGSRSVTLSASAPGFSSATATVTVLDTDVHHLTMTSIRSPSLAGEDIRATISARDVNGVLIPHFTPRLTVTFTSDSGALPITPYFAYVVSAGWDTVTFRVPTPTRNVVVTAREASGLTVSSTPFDVEAGPVDHFDWSTIPATAPAGQPFPVTLTARDSANNVVTSFTGPAKVTAIGGMQKGAVFSTLPTQGKQATPISDMTVGFSFIPSQPMRVTALRTYSGSKVSLWAENGDLTGTKLASVSTPRSSVGWITTVLPTPVLLQPSHSYVIGFLTTGRRSYYRDDMSGAFAHGSISLGLYAIGDGMPIYYDSAKYPFVDFVYEAQVQNPIPVSPTQTGSFVNGKWTGELTIPRADKFITLQASVTGGAEGESNPFNTMGALLLTLPSEIVEGTSNSSGTLTLSTPPATDLQVSLSTNDAAALTVPATVTVPAGQTSVSFPLTAPLDPRMTDQQVSVRADSSDWIGVSKTITVKDTTVNSLASGTLVAWGWDSNGQVGETTRLFPNNNPTPVLAPAGALAGKKVVAIAAGTYHNLALTAEGRLYAWGGNWAGQLGTGYAYYPWESVEVKQDGVLAGETVVAIAAGDGFSMALSADGEVFTWGSGNQGRLGNGSTADSYLPVRVVGLTGKRIVKIAAGNQHGLALDADGNVYAWGNNWGGQVGDGTMVERQIPTLINKGALAGKRVIHIAAGVNHNVVITSDGQLVSWGSNYDGQLGDGTLTQRNAPVLVKTAGLGEGRRFIAAAGNVSTSYAVTSDGRLAAWGDNKYSELGIGLSGQQFLLPQWVDTSGVLAGRKVLAVAAGSSHALALTDDMRLVTWGSNEVGQLGNGGWSSSVSPSLVSMSNWPAETRISSIACGWAHNLVLTNPTFAGFPALSVYDGASTEPPPLTGGKSVVAFGSVRNGDSLTRTLTLQNSGTRELNLFAIRVDGLNASEFTITPPTSTVLPPRGVAPWSLTFTPAHTGPASAMVHILTDDPDESTFDFAVTGTATAPPHTTLAFSSPLFTVDEQDGVVQVPILRTDSLQGTVSVKVTTINGTAGSADFTGVNQIVTFPSGVSSVSVPITILPSSASAEPNESFTVTLSQPSPGATLGNPATATIQILDSTDVTPPGAPVITVPAVGAKLNVNPGTAVTIKGTATDNQRVATVEASLGGGASYTPATVVLTGAGDAYGKTASFTVDVTPAFGGNRTVLVRSTDLRGNVSTTTTRTFAVLRPLAVGVAGPGTVTAGFAPASFREIGKVATITALPSSGALFAGWTVGGGPTLPALGIDAAALERATLTFLFQEGLVLTANFVPNPYGSEVTGTYSGLVRASPLLPDRPSPQVGGTAPGNSTEGSFTASVAGTGVMSGKIAIDGLSLSVVGVFDPGGIARFGTSRSDRVLLPRPGKPGLVLSLQIGLPGSAVPPGKIIGTITAFDDGSNAATAVSTVDADRAVYNSTTRPVPAEYLGASGGKGMFTLVLPAMSPADQPAGFTTATYPQGSGVGVISIGRDGIVMVAGTAADGSAFSAGTTVAEIGPGRPSRFGLFAPLYDRQGLISAFVNLDNTQPSSDIASGDAVWVRPAQAASQYYPVGWPHGIRVDLLAAKYAVTASKSVLKAANGENLQTPDADGNVMVTFSDGLLDAALVKAANLSTADVVTKVPVNDPTFTMTVNRATGAVIGTFTHTDGTVPGYNAIIFQKGPNAGAYGYFLTKQRVPITHDGESGGVRLIGQP